LPITDITLQGNDRINPQGTSAIRVSANLATGSTTPFSRPIQVFDSLGEAHIMTLVFSPVVPPRAGFSSSFDVTVTLPATDVLDTTSGPPLVPPANDPNVVAGGAFPLDFDNNGILDVPMVPYGITIDMSMATPNPVVFANGAADLNIAWNLLDTLQQPTISSVASSSAVTDIFQDGTPSAELTSISIADGGRINGLYSDGRSLLLAQLALQRFTNPQTLLATGNNNFVPTASSGVSAPGQANSGGLGSIVGVSLEFSNVDIAQEFTNLLTYQRGFQANSRVITTADELNQEALNLKR